MEALLVERESVPFKIVTLSSIVDMKVEDVLASSEVEKMPGTVEISSVSCAAVLTVLSFGGCIELFELHSVSRALGRYHSID